jgi:hypothetical protein
MTPAYSKSTKTLHSTMKQKAKCYAKTCFLKKSLLIAQEDFGEFSEFFVYTREIRQGVEARTAGRFLHLHAKPAGEFVDVHMDHGNVLRHPLLGGLSHLVLDVIPYWTFCLIKHKRLSVVATENERIEIL